MTPHHGKDPSRPEFRKIYQLGQASVGWRFNWNKSASKDVMEVKSVVVEKYGTRILEILVLNTRTSRDNLHKGGKHGEGFKKEIVFLRKN